MTAHSSSVPFDLPAEKTMIDVVVYVASLVSKSSDIDPQLDKVRAITSKRSHDQLTQEDNTELHEVYDYVENYLVEKEALRSFTHESVRKKVQDFLHGNKRRSNINQQLGIVWAIAICGSLASLIVPDAVVSAAVKPTFAITIFFATIHTGAAWMFWKGLANFKDEIRKAYLPICFGVVLVGLSLLQIPIVVSLGQDRSIWFQYVVSGLTVPIAEAMLYVGISRFAQLSGVKSKLLSARLLIVLCVVAVLVVNFIPRPDSGVPDWALATSITILTTGAVITLVAAWITFITRRSLSAVYKGPMAWFTGTLLLTTFTCVQYMVLQMFATPEHPFEPGGLALLSIVVSGFITLKAGTSFRRIDSATSPGAIK